MTSFRQSILTTNIIIRSKQIKLAVSFTNTLESASIDISGLKLIVFLIVKEPLADQVLTPDSRPQDLVMDG